MPRAACKKDLLAEYNIQYLKLLEIIQEFTDEQQNSNFGFEDRDQNIRDVLIHLHEWHNMVLRWYDEGTNKGLKPVIPREGYTWKTIADMNKMIWKMYQDCPLEKAKILLNGSHLQIINIINNLTEEQLYTRSYFKWTGTTTLGQYFVSAGPSHYNWAMKKIKLYKKELNI